ncbi:MAG: undecaprenyl-diphosphate phosphatase [Candidatus Cloacimonadia bacterium]
MIFILKSLLLGIIQGVTEFIPVSSSGHLVIANHFLDFELQDISFEIMLHLGTVLAVIVYFWKDIWSLLTSTVKINDKGETAVNNRKIMLYLFIATFITGIIGILMKDVLEEIFHNPLLSASMLLITGVILMISDFIPSKTISLPKTGVWRSIVIGLSQAVSIIPGISRSGTTIATSLFVGLKREEAARFTFLLSIPVILGATLLELRKMTAIQSEYLLGYIIGSVAAFISGFLVISLLLELIRKRKLKIFAIYCWVVGIATIIILNV